MQQTRLFTSAKGCDAPCYQITLGNCHHRYYSNNHYTHGVGGGHGNHKCECMYLRM